MVNSYIFEKEHVDLEHTCIDYITELLASYKAANKLDIAVVDVKPYASDMERFVPLMEKFMKFTMFKKETTNKKYHNDPYRAVNFQRDKLGISFVQMERNLCSNTRSMYTKTSTEEPKKSMSVKVVKRLLHLPTIRFES